MIRIYEPRRSSLQGRVGQSKSGMSNYDPILFNALQCHSERGQPEPKSGGQPTIRPARRTNTGVQIDREAGGLPTFPTPWKI
jgi:hypothetical protein